MKTTLNLSDQLLADAKALAAQHRTSLTRLIEEGLQLTGNDLPDAWLSAAVAHLGEHLVSFDRDFRKLLGRSQFTLLTPA